MSRLAWSALYGLVFLVTGYFVQINFDWHPGLVAYGIAAGLGHWAGWGRAK